MLVFSLEYTSTVSRTVPKWCRCAACAVEFVYPLTRTASGFGTAPFAFGQEAARVASVADAEARVAAILAEEFDVIPCPACGAYQPEMRQQLTEEHTRTMGYGDPGYTMRVFYWLLPVVGLIVFSCSGSFVSGILKPNNCPSPAWLIATGLIPLVAIVGIFILFQKARRVGREYQRLLDGIRLEPGVSRDRRVSEARARGAMTVAEAEVFGTGHVPPAGHYDPTLRDGVVGESSSPTEGP